jgi:hypothetical protein
MISSIFLYIIIPAGLIIATDALIRKRSEQDAVGRRAFLFLAWTGVSLVSTMMILYWLILPMGYGIPNLLAPVLAGVIALTLLRLQDWNKLHDRERTILLSIFGLLAVLIAVQFVIGRIKGDSRGLETQLLGLSVLTASVLLAVIWSAGKNRPVLFGIIALLYMLVFNILEGGSLPFFDGTPKIWLSILTVAVYLVLPGLVIAASMVLVSSTFNPLERQGEVSVLSWKMVTVRLLFTVLLLGLFFYTIVWLCIWDGTDDGIRGFFILMWSMLSAIAGGMIIILTSTGWRRWMGILTAILVIGLVRWAITIPGDQYRPYDITEMRGAQIKDALERYHAKTRLYPFHLSNLVPRELWRIPLPMIMPDEEWCYQGGSNFYRLGAIYREHWSSPYLSIKIYATAGDVPEGSWVCDEKLADLLVHNNQESSLPPEFTPLPTSQVAVGRTVIEPVLHATSLTVGDWSPDGRYLVFGQTRLTGDVEGPLEIDVQFLDSTTGEICSSSKNKWRAGERSDGLTGQHVWLPNGRFLYMSNLGEVAILQSCVDGVEDVTNHYPIQFTQIASFDTNTGYAVLKNQESYWLLNGATLEMKPIPDISPTLADNQRDWVSWSPNGTRFAISQVIGRDASAGAAIFIVDESSGVIERRVPLTANPETVDGPVVDWLSRDELLVQYANSLLILDLRSDPVKTTDLIRDTFQLDLSYPMDVSSMDFIRHTNSDGYAVVVRANHPHNQDVYLYESQTGQAKVFQHQGNTLLIFPDGQWLQAPKWEDTPSYKDEYDMVWMDHPEDTSHLVVEGHVPRDHPQIFPKYLPAASQLVFNSSQGISLVALPDGKTIQFWELAGSNESPSRVLPSPQGNVLVVLVEGVGLYRIPLK